MRSWIGGMSVPVVVAMLVAAAEADVKDVDVYNKSSSKVTFTSVKIVNVSDGTAVNPPAGWAAGPNRGGVVEVQAVPGGGMAPGNGITITLKSNKPGKPAGHVGGGDYKKNGENVWIGVCADPLSVTARYGGDNGIDYLGYSIPAGQWGYFYQVWNTADFTTETAYTTLQLHRSAQASNFQVIENTFSVTPNEGFDLGDLAFPDPDSEEYHFQHYMDPEDATGVAGLETELSFDALSGLLTMTFLPDDPQHGIGAGQTSSIIAFTSPNEPTFGAEPNYYSYFVQQGTMYGLLEDPPCPGLSIVPFPEPATLSLLALGGLGCLRRRP